MAAYAWLTPQERNCVEQALVEVDDRHRALEREAPDYYGFLDSLDMHGEVTKRGSSRKSFRGASITSMSTRSMNSRRTTVSTPSPEKFFFCGRGREEAILKSIVTPNEEDRVPFGILVITGQPGMGRSSMLRRFHNLLSKDVDLKGTLRRVEATPNPRSKEVLQMDQKWFSIFTKAQDRNSAHFAVFRAIFSIIVGAEISMKRDQRREIVRRFFTEQHPELRDIPHKSLLNTVIPCDMDESEATALMSGRVRNNATLILLSLIIEAFVLRERLALLVDDVHLMDRGSFDLIERLMERSPSNLIIILSLRMAEMETHYSSYISLFKRSGCVVWRELGSLERKDMAELLRARHEAESVESAIVDYCKSFRRSIAKRQPRSTNTAQAFARAEEYRFCSSRSTFRFPRPGWQTWSREGTPWSARRSIKASIPSKSTRADLKRSSSCASQRCRRSFSLSCKSWPASVPMPTFTRSRRSLKCSPQTTNTARTLL